MSSSDVSYHESDEGNTFGVVQSYVMDPPYSVTKAPITSFGTLQDVPGDGNCFLTAYWKAKTENEVTSSIYDINLYREDIHTYATNNWQTFLTNVYDSREKSIFSQFRRREFKIEDIALRAEGNEVARHRVRAYKIWYNKTVLAPIWCKDKDFKLGAATDNYGCIRYHAPILALKDKISICFYLHTTDTTGKTRYETFVVRYDIEFDSVSCWSHDSHIYPPDGECLLMWHNGTNHFNWIKRNKERASISSVLLIDPPTKTIPCTQLKSPLMCSKRKLNNNLDCKLQSKIAKTESTTNVLIGKKHQVHLIYHLTYDILIKFLSI